MPNLLKQDEKSCIHLTIFVYTPQRSDVIFKIILYDNATRKSFFRASHWIMSRGAGGVKDVSEYSQKHNLPMYQDICLWEAVALVAIFGIMVPTSMDSSCSDGIWNARRFASRTYRCPLHKELNDSKVSTAFSLSLPPRVFSLLLTCPKLLLYVAMNCCSLTVPTNLVGRL